MTKTIWNKLLAGLGIAVVSAQIFLLAYIYKKNGGTTGADPVTPTLPFIISLIISLFIFVRKGKITNPILNLTVIIVSLFGCLLPYWLERTGILVQYDRWLNNERFINIENLELRFSGFVAVELLVCIGVAMVVKYLPLNTGNQLK
ncbi:MAG: hypothetical protein LUM44_21685 [Pyrinomonadaceae bacterium]|nr:hypothetical protein [Pyrinomonadaceae bacterium]